MKVSSIFDREEYRQYEAAWMARSQELRRRRGYYDGSVYADVRSKLQWLGPRVSRGIRPLYLPLARAVDVDAGIVPGGWTLPEDAPAAWGEAIRQVWAWSAWDTDGVLYVHYGAVYGVSGLKVADLRQAGRVVVKPVDPCKFMLIPGGTYDDTPALAFWVETRLNDQGEPFEYAEVITPEEIRTFADGEPVGFDGRPPEYPNELGFVPFVEVSHIQTGEALGESTYQKAIPLLDEVNGLASYLAEIIRKHVEPQWAVIGAEQGDLVKSGDNVWFIPAGGDAKALVATIDVGGVLAFVQEIRNQVYGALPELAFDELKSKTQIATATLELQLMELVLKVKRIRPNYDRGLAEALRMAGRAAAGLGVEGVGVLDDEGLRFDPERPVLPPDPETAMRLELQALELERAKQGNGNG